MLKKVITLIFVAAVSVGATAALAANNGSNAPKPIASSLLVAANNTADENVHIQVVGTGSEKSRDAVSQDIDKSEASSSETGWLLAMALIGFVMLSNRRGV